MAAEAGSSATPTQPDPETATSINDFVVKTVKGESKTIKDVSGDAKVALIVNVASKCGFTPHYTGLQELYSKYGKDGFTVMGFPSNEFGGQEPGTEEEIEEFACSRYKVEFPMMSKVNVKGKDAHPVYQYLKKAVPGKISNEVWWNFEKFLIVDGVPTTRYASTTTPASIEKDIVKALGKETAK